ncbi:RNase adapter RapZ [Candidatus Kirkpatrickella diaphorinae]|uniref:RNase adapter RapZ n=1 Tax=Candidatus Kirkpatrickella diaphorinae TaxID=2984322 RepID=A0ABY6GHS8_9PROT|nr:RNase adapter RapZ [Candidatus Kirkpatrickella diaphorinae]UYH51064.1 RNase adapter RapZ [Candidatus Kirkpatrickella diaphorinae]
MRSGNGSGVGRSVLNLNDPQRVLLVTGVSGAGKSSMLRVLEDLGYEVVDNPPLNLVEQLVSRADHHLAIGIDQRTRGFNIDSVVDLVARLRTQAGLRSELIFATADTDALLKRFTATRRRHPYDNDSNAGYSLPQNIAREIEVMAPLRAHADLVIDTSGLSLPEFRQMVEARFGSRADGGALTLSLMSFAFPAGLPREADVVFDARFLRNPRYDESLRPKTGLDPEVQAYVRADPDYDRFLRQILDMLGLVLPRFVSEGKRHATIAVGCSGGQHRSVTMIEDIAEKLADHTHPGLSQDGPVVVSHRELARQGRSFWRWAKPPQ